MIGGPGRGNLSDNLDDFSRYALKLYYSLIDNGISIGALKVGGYNPKIETLKTIELQKLTNQGKPVPSTFFDSPEATQALKRLMLQDYIRHSQRRPTFDIMSDDPSVYGYRGK